MNKTNTITVTMENCRLSTESDSAFTVFEIEGFPFKLFVPVASVHWETWNNIEVDALNDSFKNAKAYHFAINYQTVAWAKRLDGMFADYVYVSANATLKDLANPDAPEVEPQPES